MDFDFNHFKTDENNQSDTFGESFAHERRHALFNLYSFIYSDSFQKNISLEYNLNALNANYKVPTLTLKNVEMRNFLYDYEALIYVENNNFIFKRRKSKGKGSSEEDVEKAAFLYGDVKTDVNITII